MSCFDLICCKNLPLKQRPEHNEETELWIAIFLKLLETFLKSKKRKRKKFTGNTVLKTIFDKGYFKNQSIVPDVYAPHTSYACVRV